MLETFENLDEIDKFLEKHNLLKLTQGEIKLKKKPTNQNSPITIKICE